jgi:hypothetical protein
MVEAAMRYLSTFTTFYHVQVGALGTQEFQTSPVPFWLICFSDTIKGSLRQSRETLVFFNNYD